MIVETPILVALIGVAGVGMTGFVTWAAAKIKGRTDHQRLSLDMLTETMSELRIEVSRYRASNEQALNELRIEQAWNALMQKHINDELPPPPPPRPSSVTTMTVATTTTAQTTSEPV